MGIKTLIKNFFKVASEAEPINDLSDYRRVKNWIKKAIKLYIIFSSVAVLMSFIVLFISQYADMPVCFTYIVLPPVILWSCWGYATMIMYLPQVIKTIRKTGSIGFNIGENIETTHVNVTHEYGNTYKVSSYTETKGCLFAIVGGVLGFFAWAIFCVYVGPFITFKKIRASSDNVKKYHRN